MCNKYRFSTYPEKSKRMRINKAISLQVRLRDRKQNGLHTWRFIRDNRRPRKSKYSGVPMHIQKMNEIRYNKWQETLTQEIVDNMGFREFYQKFKTFLPMPIR